MDKKYENSDYPGGSLEAALRTDNKPQLRLTREPAGASLPREDLDEVVPEFMQRGFFRSEEMPAVEAPLKAGKPRPDWESDTSEVVVPKPLKQARSPLVPLRGSAPAQVPDPPKTEPEPEELAPLRQTRTAPTPEPTPPPVASRPVSSQPEEKPEPPPSLPPREEPARVSGSLVFALLLLVGVLIWREQTRPPVPTQEPLPVPRTVNVVEEKPPVEPVPTAPTEVSPYPGMETGSDSQTNPGEPENNQESVAESQPESDTEPVEPDRRSAILEGVAETTDVDPQGEVSPPLERAEPTEPVRTDVATSAPPPAESPMIPEPWRTSGPGEEKSPSEATVAEKPPTAEKPPVVEPPKPPVAPPPKLPTVEGDPYKIAEPSL